MVWEELEPEVAPDDMISVPLTLTLLMELLLPSLVKVIVAPEPTVIVVVGTRASLTSAKRVLTAAPSITVVAPISLLHS